MRLPFVGPPLECVTPVPDKDDTPEDFSGGAWGDGTADERPGACAARGAARFGSAKADAGSGGPTVGAGAASGISASEVVEFLTIVYCQ
jgi:hypothetical protein